VATFESRYQEVLQVVRLLHSEADPYVLWHGLATILVVITSGATVALSPLILKALVDALDEAQRHPTSGQRGALLGYALGYLLLLLAGRALADVRPFLTGAINQRLHSRLTQRFFDHVLRLPMGYLTGCRGGELQHRLDLGGAGAQLATSHLTGSLLPVLVELMTMTGVLIHLGQPALVVTFGVAAFVYLVIFSAGARRLTASAHAVSTASLEAYAHLGDGLANLETLRYFTAESQMRQRLLGACCGLEKRWMKLNRLNLMIGLAASVTFAASMATSLLIGVDAVQRHAMSLGGFVLTTVYTLQMVRPIESMGSAARDLSRALGYLRPLLNLLAEPLAAESTHAAAHGAPTAGRVSPPVAVCLENLHFGYDPQRPVLRGVDLIIPAGSTTAIVGRSGSGKSSLARLLMRLYAPQQGRILLDGRDIESIDGALLRGELIALVSQETALLHETIAGNIALGRPDAPRNDIASAARGAQLDALLGTLPAGLDTPVGERGMQLSGGERQRVGIARALLRRPGLYILDEPTSMLDCKTELEIQKTLRSLGAATTIVIAHRLSTVVDADEIVVLDEGRIRERGNHRSLIARDGLYAQMWRQQMAGTTR